MDTLRRACELKFNTLVVGDPGAGVTTLLNQIARDIQRGGRAAVQLVAAQAEDVTELLDMLAATIARDDDEDNDDGDPFDRSPSLRVALSRFRSGIRGREDTTVVLDAVPGGLGHNLFGRMRDELWSLGLHWLVGTRSDDAGVLMTPPADAFFETVLRIARLDEAQIIDLLDRRDPESELGPRAREQIAARSEGNPALALALARQAVLVDPEERDEVLAADPVAEVRSALGEPAARLLADLLRAGPSGPWDASLLKRMRWSRPRAYQVFQALENAGVVRSRPERSGGAGRPRKIYEVVGP